VLGERLSTLQWAGVALAVAALALFEASPSRQSAGTIVPRSMPQR